MKGAAYAGAVDVLDRSGVLAGVRRIAGTSAGAITASLLAAGADSDGLKDSVENTNFGSFLDGSWSIFGDAARLVSHFGIYPGEHFAKLLREQLARFTHDPELTFAQLREKARREPTKYRDLYVVASNITRQRAEILCADNHPDMPIWLAVRTSMSLPLLFEAVKVRDHVFVDGGLAWNFPVDLFDHDEPHEGQPRGGNARNPKTLGFALLPKTYIEAEKADGAPPAASTESLSSFLAALGGFMYETANQQHFHPDDLSRTVLIDDLGVRTTDFKAPKTTIEALIESGRRATEAYLASQNAKG